MVDLGWLPLITKIFIANALIDQKRIIAEYAADPNLAAHAATLQLNLLIRWLSFVASSKDTQYLPPARTCLSKRNDAPRHALFSFSLAANAHYAQALGHVDDIAHQSFRKNMTSNSGGLAAYDAPWQNRCHAGDAT